jgi:catechol 2,3-dioxygenase-like lactoylglutathione lyase family enzyme
MSVIVRHVGIVVNDLEFTKNFWTNVFDFKLHNEVLEKSPYIDELIGINNPGLITLKLKDQNGFIIELLKFNNYPTDSLWANDLKTIGLTHIALTVTDIKTIIDKLMTLGFNPLSQIKTSPDKDVEVVFVNGPEGLKIEIVEEVQEKNSAN